MKERGRAEGGRGAVARELASRDPVQLVVQGSEERLDRRLIALFDRGDQRRNRSGIQSSGSGGLNAPRDSHSRNNRSHRHSGFLIGSRSVTQIIGVR
jgi:hypothetical protein